MSLSVSVGNLDVAAGPSVGRAQFEFISLLPKATGVAVLETEVLVSTLAAWEDPALSGKSVHPISSVRTLGENDKSYVRKTTWGID